MIRMMKLFLLGIRPIKNKTLIRTLTPPDNEKKVMSKKPKHKVVIVKT